MNAQNFCYWLQGYAELMEGQRPTQDQWKTIVKHLDLVFENVTKGSKASDWLPNHRLCDLPNMFPPDKAYEFPDAWKDRLPEGAEKFWLHSVDMFPFPKDGSLSITC